MFLALNVNDYRRIQGESPDRFKFIILSDCSFKLLNFRLSGDEATVTKFSDR